MAFVGAGDDQRARRIFVHDPFQFLGVHRFDLDQTIGQCDQGALANIQNVTNSFDPFVNDAAYFVVDFPSGFFADHRHAFFATSRSQKRAGRRAAVVDSTHSAHAILHDHRASDLGRSFQVVLSTSRNVRVDQLFGQRSGQQDLNLAFQFRLSRQESVALRSLHGVTECCETARNDRDLVNRVGVRQAVSNQGVPAFMVSDSLFFIVVHHATFLFQTSRDSFNTIIELVHANRRLTATSCQQSGFVNQVGQISTGETRRNRGDAMQVDAFGQLDVLNVDFQDLFPSANVWSIHQHVSIETAWSHQCLVECFRSVGRSHNDHAAVGREAIHFNQQGVQRLFSFVVAADHAAAT